MKEIYFYWLPNCTTCQKAKRRLDYHRLSITKLRDLREEPLSLEEVKNLAEKLGGVENLFSRRSVRFRELGLRDKELSENDMLDLMTTEYTFLKRPILVLNNKAIAGFFEKFFDEFVKGVKKELKMF
jgi:arsenate reductase